jgi:beta-ribofuranosylaminobenzene 5'-phosphate synthase
MHKSANVKSREASAMTGVRVNSSARLHMGFFDLHGGSGRKFGGIGVSLAAPVLALTAMRAGKLQVTAGAAVPATVLEKASKLAQQFVEKANISGGLHLNIAQAIPEHAGLGSGTQLALAIGAAISKLYDMNLNVAQISALTCRGSRSGIGIEAFVSGGFLADIGKVGDELPEIALREDFPADWRILLVTDSAFVGVHGAAELQAFKTLQPAKNSLQSMVFDEMIPALQGANLLAFGACMQDLQAYNGDYFAPVQGGRYASKAVETALNWLQENGAACVGQSSWGPTGFAILANEEQAETLKSQAQQAFAAKPNIGFMITRGKNTGASVTLD